MSWNVSVLAPRSGVDPSLREGFIKAYPEAPAETREQFEGALRALTAILPTVALEPHTVVSVVLSGHANPSHRPAKGWANDCVSIAVTQA